MTEQTRQTEREERMHQDERRLSSDEPEGDAERTDAPESGASAPAPRGEQSEGAGAGDERAPLLASGDAEGFRQRWENLQTGFVDQPREMVEQADELVAELMQRLSAGFSEKRTELETQWEKGDDVSTEELRVALTRYRSFFNRLLSA
jgi:hypothetical protein